MIQRRILLAAGIAALVAGPAFAQTFPSSTPPGSTPAQARRGGLLPQRTPTSPLEPVSREELMQRFDLNADGRIDEAEAEMARSRMRRDRAEIMRKSSIDPLTGRPRGAPPPEPPAKPADIQAVEVAPPATKPKDDELLLVPGRPDGTPAPASAAQQPANAAKQPANAPLQQPVSRQPANAARQALPTRQPPSAVTGGVRAGAPPALPGYGAVGPKADLNAGRQRTVPSAGMQPRVGGMPPPDMPSRGVPGRTAPPTAGPAGRPSIGRAPTARPVPPPRITAEDIGQ
jgi:hypothetical protein